MKLHELYAAKAQALADGDHARADELQRQIDARIRDIGGAA